MSAPGFDALEFAIRCAAGRMTEADHEWQRRGYAAWLNAGGVVSLERCLNLPVTANKICLHQRNTWLAECAAVVPCAQSERLQDAVAGAYSTFLSRGPWRQWRTHANPPPDTSRLLEAMFHVARLNGGKALSAKQIGRVLGQKYIKKCPEIGFTVEP
jgi:hypothetical protein